MSAKQTITHTKKKVKKEKKHVRCPNCGKFMGNVSSKETNDWVSSSKTNSKKVSYDGNSVSISTYSTSRKSSSKKKRKKKGT